MNSSDINTLVSMTLLVMAIFAVTLAQIQNRKVLKALRLADESADYRKRYDDIVLLHEKELDRKKTEYENVVDKFNVSFNECAELHAKIFRLEAKVTDANGVRWYDNAVLERARRTHIERTVIDKIKEIEANRDSDPDRYDPAHLDHLITTVKESIQHAKLMEVKAPEQV